MPIVILINPFIRHYAGSIFGLSDTMSLKGWTEDSRINDRMPSYGNKCYTLPDDGKGSPAELMISETMLCPSNLFNNIDLKSGPCRVTSISAGLEAPANDPEYSFNLPFGKGKINLMDSAKYLKNQLVIDLVNPLLPDCVRIKNSVTNELTEYSFQKQNNLLLNFDSFDPGFYVVHFYSSKQILCFFTLIKCYPLAIKFRKDGLNYDTVQTIW